MRALPVLLLAAAALSACGIPYTRVYVAERTAASAPRGEGCRLEVSMSEDAVKKPHVLVCELGVAMGSAPFGQNDLDRALPKLRALACGCGGHGLYLHSQEERPGGWSTSSRAWFKVYRYKR